MTEITGDETRDRDKRPESATDGPRRSRSDRRTAAIALVVLTSGCAVPVTARDLPSLEPDVPTRLDRRRIADAACPAVPNPFFFRIEKGAATSYVLGTRHTSVSLAKFPKFVIERLRASKVVVAEVAPNDGTWTRYPRLDLVHLLGSSTWQHYADLVGSGADRAREIGRPDAALAIMSLLFEDTDASMDRDIAREAALSKVPIRGLETAKFQHDLLERLIDVRFLRALIDHTPGRRELEAETLEDLRSYCDGTKTKMSPEDHKRLFAAGYSTSELDTIDEELVFARTAAWLPLIESSVGGGETFIAIGLDHLIGARGVLALLSAHGYAVTRISDR